MRKLISALVVIAVVSCALAFKVKPSGTLYCASTTQNSGCRIIDKKESVGPSNYFLKRDWNGINCPATDCPTPIRLISEV
jgi:hypothetical protein